MSHELAQLPCCKSFTDRLGMGCPKFAYVPKCECGSESCFSAKSNRVLCFWLAQNSDGTMKATPTGSIHPYEGKRFAKRFNGFVFNFN